MSKVLDPLAKVGSIGLDHMVDVVDKLDPKAVVEKLDPKAVVEKLDAKAFVDKLDAKALVEKLDPHAVAERLDPRPLVGKLEQLDPRARRKPPKRRGRRMLVVLAVIGVGGVVAYFVARRRSGSSGAPGRDTATGTDPDAKYDHPGYEDKSLGQAVNADMDLVDDLVDQERGDLARAEQRFEQESAGSPARQRQSARGA